jgi:RNA polymerase sigma factor (sigma-70 family)
MTVVALPLGRARPLTEEQRQLLASEPWVVRNAVGAVAKRYGWVLAAAEMLQVGEAAVVVAARSYDAARGSFGRWAFYSVVHAILDAGKSERRHETLVRAVRARMLGRLAREGRRDAESEDEREDLLDVYGKNEDRTPESLAKLCGELVDEAFEGAWTSGPEEVVGEREEAAVALRSLREALAELSSTQREMLALRFHEGVSVEEVAHRMGTSERTLRRESRALEAFLRARLNAVGITSVPAWFRGESGSLFREADRERDPAP